MYTEAQYQQAKGLLGRVKPEHDAILRQKIEEFERPNVGQVPKDVPDEAPLALPPEAPGAMPVGPKAQATLPSAAAYNAPAPESDTLDMYLPNASKQKALDTPPEYVAKNKFNGLKHIALAIGQTAKDVTVGNAIAPGAGAVMGALRSRAPLSANMYYEPSENTFEKEQGPLIKARKLQPGTEDFDAAFAEYKDRKWAQAYQQAAAEDRPLTRAEYVQHSGAWDKLKDALASAPDVAQSFAKGVVNGLTGHLGTTIPAAVEDKLTGSNKLQENEDQEARNPVAETTGELAGAFTPFGPLARIGEAAGGAVRGASAAPGLLRNLAGSVAAGNAGAVADLAGRSASRGIEDVAQGGDTSDARSSFLQGLLPTVALGTGGAILGHGIAGAGNWAAKRITQGQPEIAELRPGGADTHALWGVTPGKDVAANIEAARPAIPGEMKEMLPGSPNATTIAARKLQEPLTAENAAAHTEAYQKIDAEQNAAFDQNPELQKEKPAAAAAKAIADWGLSKLRTEAQPKWWPGINDKLAADQALPAANLGPVRKLADKIWAPKLVTAVDAGGMANRYGGKAVTLDEARQLGVDVGSLSKGLGGEGVPMDAPPIPVEPEVQEEVMHGPSAQDVFGMPAEKPGEFTGPVRGPDYTRAKKSPVPVPGSDWYDERGAAEKFAVHNGGGKAEDRFGGWRDTVPSGQPTPDTPTAPMAAEAPSAAAPSIRPSGAPSALRTPPQPVASAASPSSGAAIGGIPESEYRVILEPRAFNAKQYETILGDIDKEAKYGQARGEADPQWKNLARAFRQDREQFGKPWADLIESHHQLLNSLEQRAGAAGFTEKRPYSEMQPSSRDAVNARLEGYPGHADTKVAMSSLASDADARAQRVAAIAGEAPPPGVLHDLEVLGSQNAYTKLKGLAVPKIGEALGAGGMSGHIRGLGPFLKLRGESAARSLAAGPTGEPTVTPRLLDYVKRNAPRGKFLPGMAALGGGALGIKAGVGYNAAKDNLTDSQKQFLQKLIEAHQEAP